MKKVFYPRYCLYSVIAWTVCAIITVPIAAWLMRHSLSGKSFGYLCSALSYVTAFAAGGYLALGKMDYSFREATFISVLLIILLLTVGGIISDGAADSGAILSVITFTAAGCYTAMLLNIRTFAKKRVTVRQLT